MQQKYYGENELLAKSNNVFPRSGEKYTEIFNFPTKLLKAMESWVGAMGSFKIPSNQGVYSLEMRENIPFLIFLPFDVQASAITVKYGDSPKADSVIESIINSLEELGCQAKDFKFVKTVNTKDRYVLLLRPAGDGENWVRAVSPVSFKDSSADSQKQRVYKCKDMGRWKDFCGFLRDHGFHQSHNRSISNEKINIRLNVINYCMYASGDISALVTKYLSLLPEENRTEIWSIHNN